MDLNQIITIVITGLLSIGASTGFWAFLTNRRDKKSARTKLLIGLAHDRIMFLGSSYIQRGYISQDEYENLHTYLYEPYSEAGGNGSAAKVMLEVNKLPLWHPVKLQPPNKKEIEYGNQDEH